MHTQHNTPCPECGPMDWTRGVNNAGTTYVEADHKGTQARVHYGKCACSNKECKNFVTVVVFKLNDSDKGHLEMHARDYPNARAMRKGLEAAKRQCEYVLRDIAHLNEEYEKLLIAEGHDFNPVEDRMDVDDLIARLEVLKGRNHLPPNRMPETVH